MKENPLRKLEAFGQSIWLDFIRRGMITSGEIAQLIQEDGLSGVTVNPSILEKAISGSHDYDQAIRALALEDKDPAEIYESLAVEDVQRAADLFRPIYDRTEGYDGFVSLEVSPYLAYDTQGTLTEARRFWAELDRPNVMIKVPSTQEGLAVIQQLTSEGINVNVTLLFGLPRYREVVEAFLAGLEQRLAQKLPLERISSVASFFLSRIDVMIDPVLEKQSQAGGPGAGLAKGLQGKAAIASARLAYQIYREAFGSPRFEKLAAAGAQTQRLLWASTSTKNPAYPDVMYVEALIGADTVNTLPLETIHAYRDHGNPALTLEQDVADARQAIDKLGEASIDLDAVTKHLEEEGVAKFRLSYDSLLKAIGKQVEVALKEPLDRQVLAIGNYIGAVREQIASLESEEFSASLWRKDPISWKSDPLDKKIIDNSLGWLHVIEKMEENLPLLDGIEAEVRAASFSHVVLLGMGGSSLAPLVFQKFFGGKPDQRPFTVLDTTDPATIYKVEQENPVANTLFIVASKSGTTVEPLALGDYFFDRVKAAKGQKAGENFMVITDPGSMLTRLARERGYRQTILNYVDIGGRFSALSFFGLVPAALIGVDTPELLVRGLRMVHACASCVPVSQNPGLVLGAVMGELKRYGRDKVTLLTPEGLSPLTMWLEQLIAESTGKAGKGILPVAGEPAGKPQVYGNDRLFIYIDLREEQDKALKRRVDAIEKAGHPVVKILMDDRLDVGQEFFRWEIATATVGAVLGINAFDQPNVQESKEITRQLLSLFSEQGRLPEEEPRLIEGALSVFAGETGSSVEKVLARFFDHKRDGDYLSLMAFLPEEPATQQALQSMRLFLRDKLHLATTLGYGPRYLHSTGQFHKGGPNNGLFLIITADDRIDLRVPGSPYTFGVLKRAQALGDRQALRNHGRRVIHVHLGADVGAGLSALDASLKAALIS